MKTNTLTRTTGMLRELLWLEHVKATAPTPAAQKVATMKCNWLAALIADMERIHPDIHTPRHDRPPRKRRR